MNTHSLENIVRVDVDLSPRSAPRKGFNLGLIVGKSAVVGPTERVRVYDTTSVLEEMMNDGFDYGSEEYQAALIYISQSKRPPQIAIGAWDAAESAAEAVKACREANSEWWAATVCDITESEALECAAYIETTLSAFFYATQSEDVRANQEGNILSQLKTRNYRRTLSVYSQTAQAAAGIMGYAMGANTKLTNSAYTLMFKKIVGIPTDTLSASDLANIKANNGNVYINYGETYDIFEEGTMADSTWFDEVLNLDMLANELQLSVMDLLVSRTKVPQTEEGVSMLIHAMRPACNTAVKTGFIAPGIWNGEPIMSVETGDMLPLGYTILSESIADQSQADRDSRIAPPVYVLCKLGGALHNVMISVKVNR